MTIRGGHGAHGRPGSARAVGAAALPLGTGRPLRNQVTPAGDRRGVGVGAFLLAVATAGALTHVAVRLKGLEVAYALGRERRISADLEEQRRGLQIEIGMLKDPGRVVMIARDKLKMGPPAAEAIRALGPGQILTAGVPPAPLASGAAANPGAKGGGAATAAGAKRARTTAPTAPAAPRGTGR